MREDKLQKDESRDNSIRVDLVRSWQEEQIVDLYRVRRLVEGGDGCKQNQRFDPGKLSIRRGD